jgi:LysM repeat protein
MTYPYSKQYPPRVEWEHSQCQEENCYVVQTGDTLYALSRFYNVSLDDLIDFNPHIKPEQIIPGEVICIPLTTPPVNCPIGASTYTIAKGDTFYSIAKKYKMRLSALLKANPNINPDALLIGQSICIPMISSSYTNKAYRIKLMYPYLWSKIDNLRFEGIGGFFQLSIVSGDASINEAGFRNGMTYFCGLCRPALPPYVAYPVVVQLTPGADQEAVQTVVDSLVAQAVNVVYVSPPVEDSTLFQALSAAGIQFIASARPTPDLQQNWAASLLLDPLPALDTIWPDLVQGISGQNLPVELNILPGNPAILTPGRETEAKKILQDLLDGFIDPGTQAR